MQWSEACVRIREQWSSYREPASVFEDTIDLHALATVDKVDHAISHINDRELLNCSEPKDDKSPGSGIVQDLQLYPAIM